MRPDPALASATVWTAQIGDDTVTFGPFQATHVKRSWTSSDSATTGPVTSADSSQSWSFDLGALHVECVWRAAETSVAIGKSTVAGKTSESLSCSTARGTGPRGAIRLVHDDARWTGSAEHEGVKLGLRSRHELEGGSTSGDPVGFEASDVKGVFAAIQTINTPAVWMNPGDEKGQELAAAAMVATYFLAKVPERHP